MSGIYADRKVGESDDTVDKVWRLAEASVFIVLIRGLAILLPDRG